MCDSDDKSHDQISKQGISDSDLKQQVDALGKRISVTQWFVQTALTITGLFVIALVVYAAINLYVETQKLHKVETELNTKLSENMNSAKEKAAQFEISITDRINETMKREADKTSYLERKVIDRLDTVLGTVEGKPKLELFAERDEPLEAKTIDGRLISSRERAGFDLEFDIIIKNAGDKRTEPLTLKIYFGKPIKIHATPGTADEKDFESELTFSPDKIPLAIFYPGVSVKVPLRPHIGSLDLPKERVSAMLKIFYGGEKPCASRFYLKIKPS